MSGELLLEMLVNVDFGKFLLYIFYQILYLVFTKVCSRGFGDNFGLHYE